MRCPEEYQRLVVIQAARNLATVGSARDIPGSPNMRTVLDGELRQNEGMTLGTDVGVQWFLTTIRFVTGVR